MATKSTPGYNKGKYTFEQQVVSLSWSTVLTFNLTGTAEEIASQAKEMLLEVLGEPAVQKLIGVWNLVWGPGVYAGSFVGSTKSLNAMFIAVPEEDPQQAVVAIAGTNGTSLMDWIVEDFNVGHKVPWPFGFSPLNPEISAGTFYGLDKLVSMKAKDSIGNPPATARQFLATQSFTKVMVTGHSLGGALSPCYTLYLDETRPAWNASGSAALSCLPTAGPTPGDVGFSKYYDARLLPSTSRVWNSMDVVPHAFNARRLGEVATLYEPNLYSSTIAKLIASLQRWTMLLNYVNISPETQGFPSKFYSIDDFKPQHKALTDEIERLSGKYEAVLETYEEEEPDSKTGFCPWGSRTGNLVDAVAFIVQALIQHTIGYLVYFGIEEFSTLMTEASKQSVKLLSDPDESANRIKSLLTELKAPILLDLGEKSSGEIKDLLSGQGPLLSAIFDKIAETSKGKVAEGAQSVVFLVEEDEDDRSEAEFN
jgi:hypothetical protein